MSDKKPGRPTEFVKNSLLKVRVNNETLEIIDGIAKENKQSRSEVIRDVLPIISSKDFEQMISLSSLQRLEQYSLQCYEYFSKLDKKIKVAEVSTNFPAYVDTMNTPPTLFIKYPTFKVKILLQGEMNATKDKIESILKDVDGKSIIYFAQCFLMDRNVGGYKQTFLPELMCLKTTLKENILLKDEICSLLSLNNVQSEVWPAYYVMGKDINILIEDEEAYIIPYRCN